MSTIQKLKLVRRLQRKSRIKGSVRGSTERPRLSVFRSIKNISVQIIDDTTGKTLVSVGSVDKAFRTTMKHGWNITAAKAMGKAIADMAKEKGITLVAFDRNGYKYHGRVKALADAAREGGLKF